MLYRLRRMSAWKSFMLVNKYKVKEGDDKRSISKGYIYSEGRSVCQYGCWMDLGKGRTQKDWFE